MKKGSAQTPREKLIDLLMRSLALNRDQTDAFIAAHPEFLTTDLAALSDTLSRIQYHYLFTRTDTFALMKARPDLFLAPHFIEKENLLKETLNITDIEFGKVLKNNIQVMDVDNSKIVEFFAKLEQTCRVSKIFTKNLMVNFFNVHLESNEETLALLQQKLKLMFIHGITLPQIEVHATFCGSGIHAIDYKLKLARLSKTPLSTFMTNGHYKHNLDRTYAKFRSRIDGLHRANIYSRDKDFLAITNIQMSDLINRYPWNEDSAVYVDQLFAKYYPQTNAQVESLFAEYNNMICKQEESEN